MTHALTGEGHDASEDGTGRGTPLVPGAFDARQSDVCVYGDLTGPLDTDGQSVGVAFAYGISSDALDRSGEGANGSAATRSEVQAIAFTSKDYGGDAMNDCSPTLRAGGHADSHANAGVPPAVAINLRGREGGAMPETDTLASLRAADGGSSRSYVQPAGSLDEPDKQSWAVRRLMPVECERLQGFPDDHTQVPYRGKPTADGPRYKMIGNSWAVPVFAWVGARIDALLTDKPLPVTLKAAA